MPSALESEIKIRISAFAEELDLLVRKSTLEALKGILSAGSAPTARRGRPSGKGRGPGRPRAAGRSSGNVDEAAEKIEAHVKANDGLGVSEIATSTGTALPVAKKALSQLIASGTLKKSGQKRGTKYHVGSGKAPSASRKKGRKAGKRGRKAKRVAKSA